MSRRTDVPASHPARLHIRVLALTGAALLSVGVASCGSDDDGGDDGVDRTEVTSANNSVVPGQPQEQPNVDPADSQVTPTLAP